MQRRAGIAWSGGRGKLWREWCRDKSTNSSTNKPPMGTARHSPGTCFNGHKSNGPFLSLDYHTINTMVAPCYDCNIKACGRGRKDDVCQIEVVALVSLGTYTHSWRTTYETGGRVVQGFEKQPIKKMMMMTTKSRAATQCSRLPNNQQATHCFTAQSPACKNYPLPSIISSALELPVTQIFL